MRFPGRGHLYQPAICFGSQGAMHEPLGIPGRLAGALLGLTEQAQEMRHAEGSEPCLFPVSRVWIARIERCVLLEEPNSRIVKRYQQTGVRVGVNVDGEIPTGAGVARDCLELVRTEWTYPILD